jgi:hypothetical protein
MCAWSLEKIKIQLQKDGKLWFQWI